MVRKRHESIVSLTFRNPERAVDIETFSLAALKTRVPASFLARPQRLDFHQLMLVHASSGSHHVDFEMISLERGTLLHVRPGQVQKFDAAVSARATLLVFTPAFAHRHEPQRALPGAVDDSGWWPTALHLKPDLYARVRNALSAIERAYARHDESIVSRALLRALLDAFVYEVALSCKAMPPIASAERRDVALFAAFRRLAERYVGTRGDVRAFAAQLGCSERSLGRCTQRVAGVTPKAYFDGRVALEAKRLLAHTDRSVAAIAEELGFSEATNFVKFFKRRTHTTPAAFREAVGKA